MEDKSSTPDDKSGGDDSSDIEIVEFEPEGGDNETPHIRNEGLESTQCPICLEVPDIFAVAECGHAFCHECVESTLTSGRFANKRHGQCPLCRKNVRYCNTLYLELKIGQRPPQEDSKPEGGLESSDKKVEISDFEKSEKDGPETTVENEDVKKDTDQIATKSKRTSATAEVSASKRPKAED